MRRDLELERALRELEVPQESAAEERAWALVRAAYAEREPIRPAPRVRRLALIAAGGLAALAIGLSPAGAKVGDLVKDAVGIGQEDARPALRSLPAAGELVVESERGPWIVRADGSKRLLGDFEQATWSPHGLFVAVTAGRELLALEPDGDVRWSIDAAAPIHDPRWGGVDPRLPPPYDTRIAYRSGDDLRVVAGDGTAKRLVARHVAPVAPVWLAPPAGTKLGAAPAPLLAYLDRQRRVHVVDVDTLAAVRGPIGARTQLRALRSGGATSPVGSQVARLEQAGARDRLVLTRRGGSDSVLFSAPGRLTGPTWSPDGRWLLVGWPAADQWLFVDVAHPRRTHRVNRIREQFDPGGSGATGRFPHPSSWILPQT
jgi:hypothetical protein